jgi:hypothetical protein
MAPFCLDEYSLIHLYAKHTVLYCGKSMLDRELDRV